MNIKEALNRVVAQLDLSTEEMQDVMREIMTGQCSEAQIGAFLMGLRMKSESIDEIVGAVSVMARIFSTCRLPPLLSWQRRAARWPSMVTAPFQARVAAPICLRRPGFIWN